MADNGENKATPGLGRMVAIVSGIGLIGLIVSITLLMDYKEPLLNVWKLILKSVFGAS